MLHEETRTVAESRTTMSELVFPNHTNVLGNLMGGQLMYWMDTVSAICAQKHTHRACVTLSVDHISFRYPIRLGNLVNLEARVTRAFSTSMEIFIDVIAENMTTGERFQSNSAFFTFVALDQNGRPTQVPKLLVKTPEEKELFDDAWTRREHRLKISGDAKK
ncbi:MAG: acyl-CoA thioesterase [Cytophagales bacterium]|nr:acyl-CoA thioesterase [Cytophagales bacterium]